MVWELLGWSLGIVLLGIGAGASGWYLYQHQDHIYPGIHIDQQAVGGLTAAEARQKFAQDSDLPSFTITLINSTDPEQKLASSSAELGIHKDVDEAVAFAYAYGRTGSTWQRLQAIFHAPTKQPQITTRLRFTDSAVADLAKEFNQLIAIPGKPASLELKRSGVATSLELDPGEPGQVINESLTAAQLASLASTKQDTLLAITPEPELPVLTTEEQEQVLARANKFVGKSLTATAEDHSFTLNDQALLAMLGLPSGFQAKATQDSVVLWAEKIDRPAQIAKFNFNDDTLQVTEFQPDKPGLILNQEQTQALLQTALIEIENGNQSDDEPLALPLQTSEATTTLADTNSLGISSRIGWGESWYQHSIPNRIHNVEVTTNRVNNIIIPPNTEFSFNQALGEVSAQTGFRSAYVIRNGRTELGDGGGVCQVSTTLFRALLDAGLPITKRLPHSYRVGYYEQNSEPGFDATVYAGNVDLRFKNDTGQHLLLHFEIDSEDQYLKTELYGTSDGRTTEISKYKKWGATAAPPAEYIPDPTLAPGQTRQIDWAVGGLKTEFTHTVKDKSGQTISEKVYTSNYKPWSAKYLVGQ